MNDFLYRIEQKLIAIGRKRPWLARESGVKIGTINSWFNRDSYPTVDDACPIAEVLNTTVEYLLTGKEEIKEEKDQHLDPLAEEMIEYIKRQPHDKLVKLQTVAELLPLLNIKTPEEDTPRSSKGSTPSSPSFALEKIGEGLVKNGHLSVQQVNKVLQEQKKNPSLAKRFGEIAVELQLLEQHMLDEYLSELEKKIAS